MCAGLGRELLLGGLGGNKADVGDPRGALGFGPVDAATAGQRLAMETWPSSS